jgi:predicted nucleic acid-binding protein
MALIIDASVAVGWIVRTQATALSSAALSHVAHDFGCVPSYFGIEVGRALRTLESRSLITAELVNLAIAQLRALPLKQDNSTVLDRMPEIIALARGHALRVADAAYLELAIRTALPLATRDRSLARAAETAGVALFKS